MTVDEVLAYWFGDVHDNPAGLEARNRMWYRGGPGVDREIGARFGAAVEAAAAGGLDTWLESPRGELALIILLDQFSRSIYRRTARAFAQDELARAICHAGLERGSDRRLRTLERSFFYSPLHHSEALADHEECRRRFERLVEECEPELRKKVAESLDYAVEHCEVVRRFGRFPHRNAILGRDSTAEETAYLEGGAETYGQGPPEDSGPGSPVTS